VIQFVHNKPDATACAVIEQTADGRSCGRCWFHVRDGICPRHGDVSAVQRRYVETGKLTLESEHRKEPAP
jgi:hypothetical protein